MKLYSLIQFIFVSSFLCAIKWLINFNLFFRLETAGSQKMTAQSAVFVHLSIPWHARHGSAVPLRNVKSMRVSWAVWIQVHTLLKTNVNPSLHHPYIHLSVSVRQTTNWPSLQEWAFATLLVILTTTPLMGSCTPSWVPALTRWWQYATSLWWHPSPLWPRTKNAASQKLRMFAPWPSTCPLPTSPSARTEEYWWESKKERGRDGVVVLTMLDLHVLDTMIYCTI